MYSLYSPSNRRILVTILALGCAQLLFMCNAASLNLTNAYLHHKCLVSQGKYKPGSEYEENLESQIRRISTGNFRYGSEEVTSGEGPNSATIIYQCRGDSYWSKCRSCYAAAISGIQRRCPRNKGGMIWFDQCFLQITAISVIDAGIKIDYENNFSLHNQNKVNGDANSFNKETMALLENLTLKASCKENMYEGKLALYAAGEKSLGTKKLYAMVQCKKEIFTPKMCKECLGTIIRGFPKCCGGKQGGRILGTSCNFRYELYPFLRT